VDETEFVRERHAALDALAAFVSRDPRIEGLWLQGSLARDDADPLSDIDAHLSVRDAAFDEVFGGREALLSSIRPIIAWSDGTAPGLRLVHALLDDGVRLDLCFETAARVADQKRPAIRMVVDKGDLAARLNLDWEAPVDVIRRIIEVTVRMTRQGGTWPLRTLRRGQWSTFAMMELDLINGQLAQLMAVQTDPANVYQNPFSLYRRLDGVQQTTLDGLTTDALAALTNRDLSAMLAIHLKVFDALVHEGRKACAALGVAYPVAREGDAKLRRLLQDAWPS
jgi:predicted nucleotidyltransferase